MYMNQNNPQINFEEENEREQLLRMEKLRKLVQQLLLRHLFLFGLLFLLILLLLSALLVVRNKRSATRFTAELELLYQPKESSYYKPIDDHAMLQLFGRNTTFSSTTEELARTGAAGRLTNDNIEIHQKRNQNRLFQILASANTGKDAILKANTFARVCMEQYRAFRLADLANWMDAIQQQKKRLEQSIRENAEQAVRLSREVGLTDPASELERLRQHISEQKQTLSELVIRQANMAMRKQKLSLLISHLDPNALRNAAKIKEQLKDLKETDDEVLVQSQLYTDSNPKLLALKARREAMRKAYDDFLRREGIKSVSEESLRAAEKLRKEFEEASAENDNLTANLSVLRQELAKNEAAMKKLIEILPQLNQLKLHQETNRKNLETVEHMVTDLNYLKVSAEKELQPLEFADRALEAKALDKKKIAIVLFLSLFLTGFAAVALLVFKFTTGKVESFKELDCYFGIVPLGILPRGGNGYGPASHGRNMLGEIYYTFFDANPKAKLVFIGHLPGSETPPELAETLLWQSASNGKRVMILRIVDSASFEENGSMTLLHSIFCSGGEGFLPVENPYMLTHAELSLLKEDLKELGKNFDLIFITRELPVQKQGLFFRQMFAFCDASIILVGAERTPRMMLRHVININKSNTRPLYAVIIGNPSRDMEQKG